MRFIAIILNILQIISFVYLLITKGISNGKNILLVFLVIATPIVTLLSFYLSGSENWISLYLRRKVLEEKKKIERLNEQNISNFTFEKDAQIMLVLKASIVVRAFQLALQGLPNKCKYALKD